MVHCDNIAASVHQPACDVTSQGPYGDHNELCSLLPQEVGLQMRMMSGNHEWMTSDDSANKLRVMLAIVVQEWSSDIR